MPSKKFDYPKAGDEAYEKGDFAAAADYYRKAIEADAGKASNHYGLGLALYRLKDYEAAASSFARAVKITPKNADARYKHALALERAGEYGKALSAYEKALKLKPSLKEAVRRAGVAAFKAGDLKKAVKHLKKAVELGAADQLTLTTYALALRDGGKPKDSLAVFDQAIAAARKKADVWCFKAGAYHLLKDFDAARKCLKSALKADRNHAPSYYMQGLLLADESRYGEAAEAFTHALQSNPNYAEAYVERGNALVQLGEFQRAVIDFQRALDHDPENVPGLLNAATLFHLNEQPDVARIFYKRAFAIQPTPELKKILKEL